jgi:hypothetical protein
MSKKHLISGEEYTLSDILSGEYKIIIPDLQRDYCWGNKAYDKENKAHELVSGFVTSLIDLFNKNRDDKFTLGLIYGFEQPDSHIQLCDGQQRITTLFLLLGILNRKTDGKFQKYLISDSELKEDDKEPYLQYAIRESTLYFLSDLVCEFFLNKNLDIENIKQKDWYFKEYDLDASITSIIEALILIEKKLNEEENLNFADFGNFIVNKLQMLYYDMGNRTQGEETFVVINTTGEPLTATENLKPIFINNLPIEKQQEASKLWEDWETFFWQHRKGDGSGKNDTADKGFLEFFRWLLLLNSKDKEVLKSIVKGNQINIDELQLQEIQEYFEIVKYVFTESDIFSDKKEWLAPEDMNSQIHWFQILPVLEYIKRFGKRFGKDNERNVVRVKRFFKNMSRNRNVGGNIANILPLAITIIKELPSADIASIITMENVPKTLLTDEERLKFNIYKGTGNREELEKYFWKEEDHKVWEGEIIPILEWSGAENFDFEMFKKYSKIFSILFHDKMNKELDITRRALLTRNIHDYPRKFTGYTNYSFCWEYSDWKTLIDNNRVEFKLFFDELLDKDENAVYSEQEKIIKNNSNKNDYSEFVENPALLEYCREKNIQWDYEQKCWILIAGNRRSGRRANIKSYTLYLKLKEKPFWNCDIWTINFYQYDKTCVCFDNKNKITIDVFYIGNEEYQLQVFQKGNLKSNDTIELLSNVANSFKLKWNGERYDSESCTYKEIDELLRKIILFLS